MKNSLRIFAAEIWRYLRSYFKGRKALAIGLVLILILALGGCFLFKKSNRMSLGIKSLGLLNKVSEFLPIPADEKQELNVVNELVGTLTKKDDQIRTYMIFLQNNMELRPGGGFLGQYAIIKIKNGEVVSSSFEDANLLDQKIQADVAPPYPFKRMMQIKKWKFRDSNFSPDFPANIEKAKYFYRLAGNGNANFDGYIAVNAQVFNDVLSLTGPVTVNGIEFNSQNGFLKLEEVVEKAYLMDPKLDTQNRKAIMRQMMPIIINKLFTLGNITKIAELGHNELKNKSIMLNFKDPALESLVGNVHWDGKVSDDWSGDYLMLVDANMGALKTNYYIQREVFYSVDLTGEKPTAEVKLVNKNTARIGDWRTSDYHAYLRIYTPKGSAFLDRKMVGYPNITEEFNKTCFGMIMHTVLNNQTEGYLKYELPENLDRDNYRLLIQKQSGFGDVPVHVSVITKDGQYKSDQTLLGDLKFELKQQ